jgi:polyhydroxyalkanoate synthesis regulator phasin
VPSATGAADALAHDVNAGVTSGAISSKTGKSLVDELNQALAASSNGQQDQVASALTAMNATINRDVQAGTMTQSEASTLRTDVATLASALGVSTTNTTSPTGTTGTGPTTSTSSGGGDGNGNGNGH